MDFLTDPPLWAEAVARGSRANLRRGAGLAESDRTVSSKLTNAGGGRTAVRASAYHLPCRVRYGRSGPSRTPASGPARRTCLCPPSPPRVSVPALRHDKRLGCVRGPNGPVGEWVTEGSAVSGTLSAGGWGAEQTMRPRPSLGITYVLERLEWNPQKSTISRWRWRRCWRSRSASCGSHPSCSPTPGRRATATPSEDIARMGPQLAPTPALCFLCWFLMAAVPAALARHFGEGIGTTPHVGVLLWLGYAGRFRPRRRPASRRRPS